jgi:hypothetical protein
MILIFNSIHRKSRKKLKNLKHIMMITYQYNSKDNQSILTKDNLSISTATIKDLTKLLKYIPAKNQLLNWLSLIKCRENNLLNKQQGLSLIEIQIWESKDSKNLRTKSSVNLKVQSFSTLNSIIRKNKCSIHLISSRLSNTQTKGHSNSSSSKIQLYLGGSFPSEKNKRGLHTS